MLKNGLFGGASPTSFGWFFKGVAGFCVSGGFASALAALAQPGISGSSSVECCAEMLVGVIESSPPYKEYFGRGHLFRGVLGWDTSIRRVYWSQMRRCSGMANAMARLVSVSGHALGSGLDGSDS